MKAAVMTEPFNLEIQEVPKPSPSANEVVVRVVNAGICGSDLHFYDGTNPYAKYPQICGHELSGVVDQVGSAVKVLKVGERVVIEPAVGCGTCYPCRIGKRNCCSNLELIGIVSQGGFAEYVLVEEEYIHVIPEQMSFEVGAIVEPFTIGAQIVSRANVSQGCTVTILGAGPIGLTVLILLKNRYDVQVTVVDVVPERLKLAHQFGADFLINPKQTDLLKKVRNQTKEEMSNIVIETAGLGLTMEQTIDLVSAGGRIVIAGVTSEQVTFPGALFTNKEVEIFGSRNSVGKFPEIIEFLFNHPTIAPHFISKKIPLGHIANGFHLAKNYPNRVNKIILEV
jgi:L-gulonate 5-dehydrogenase